MTAKERLHERVRCRTLTDRARLVPAKSSLRIRATNKPKERENTSKISRISRFLASSLLPLKAMAASSRSLDTNAFYSNYAGHLVPHLDFLLNNLPADRPKVYLAGDSSLDNKFWFPASAWKPATNGYESILEPPKSRPDIAHLMNDIFKTKSSPFICINAAIEESTLGSRGSSSSSLKEQDVFIRDHISTNDVLIVSVGGNDIALRPTPTTALSMGSLIAFSSDSAIDAGNAVGMGHFIDMFGPRVSSYIERMCEKAKPKLVIVCMIYYPHEKPGGSWADTTLSLLRYNTSPGRLQHLIRKVYELGTCQVQVQGVKVVPCPLFEILDPSVDSKDYIARVEPSEIGGKKMAERFVEIIERELPNTS